MLKVRNTVSRDRGINLKPLTWRVTMCTPKTVSERKCGCVRVCVCVEGSWPMILMHTYIYTVNKFIDRVIGILWPPCLQSFECSRFWRRCVKCGNCVGIRKVIKFCQEESCKIKFSLNQQNFLFCIQLWNFLLNLLNTYVLVGADSYAHATTIAHRFAFDCCFFYSFSKFCREIFKTFLYFIFIAYVIFDFSHYLLSASASGLVSLHIQMLIQRIYSIP